MKKGDLSINIIIIAAIALLVLVILSILLFRSGTSIQQGTSCSGVGGVCSTDPTCADVSYQYGAGYKPSLNFECTDSSPICCIKI